MRITSMSKMLLVYFFCCYGTVSLAYGEEDMPTTKIDPRDKYLSMEALCGYEGMPYEFLIPREDYVKTKNHPGDVYLDMESLCGEDPPYKYVVIPGMHMKQKLDPRELEIGPEEMLSEDPSVLGITK